MKLPAFDCMMRLLERVVPGKSASIATTRDQMLAFAGSLTSKSVLLRGPIGAGKSTIARILGLLKRVAPLTAADAEQVLQDARFDAHNRIDPRCMPWYVELPLTGLVESLAEVQLFGVTKGAFTGADVSRAGVFEQALTGRTPKGPQPTGALLTGGVVFLDEIGDLSGALQAKLLPALSGGTFYRIGGEGNEDYEVTFRGVTISASWKHLDDGAVRPDLMSRLAAYGIDVPGLNDRPEDFDAVFDGVQTSLLDAMRHAIDDACRQDPASDRAYWIGRRERIVPVPDRVRRQFKKIDWGEHGNLRGLSAALEQVIAVGASPAAVLERLPRVSSTQEGWGENRVDLLSDLMTRATGGVGLAGQVKEIEVANRGVLRTRLLADESVRRRLAKRLGVSGEQILASIYQLDRRRLGVVGGTS